MEIIESRRRGAVLESEGERRVAEGGMGGKSRR